MKVAAGFGLSGSLLVTALVAGVAFAWWKRR